MVSMAASEQSYETVSFRAPPELIKRIEELAQQGPYEIPKSEIWRKAAWDHVEQHSG